MTRIKTKILGNGNYIQRMLALEIPREISRWSKRLAESAGKAFIDEIKSRILDQRGKWKALKPATIRRKKYSVPERAYDKWIEKQVFLKQLTYKLIKVRNGYELTAGAFDDINYKGERAQKSSITMYRLALLLERGGKAGINGSAVIIGRPLFRPAAMAMKKKIMDKSVKTLSGISMAWGKGVIPHGDTLFGTKELEGDDNE